MHKASLVVETHPETEKHPTHLGNVSCLLQVEFVTTENLQYINFCVRRHLLKQGGAMSPMSVVVAKIIAITNKANTPFILHAFTVEMDSNMMLVDSSVQDSYPNRMVSWLSMFIHIAFE